MTRLATSLKRSGLSLALCCVSIGPAYASCGAAFCPINTQWEVQGAWEQPGARVDLRQEFIDQDQPRHRRDRIDVGEISHHHDEVRTLNRNWLLTLDYTFSARWGVSVTLPYINRDHRHIHNHHGAKLGEAWDIEELGDARLLGRFQPEGSGINLLYGLKLPTGKFDAANSEGAEAERSLQPGTGTTDVLLGASYHASRLNSPWSWFVQGLWQQPLNKRAEYRTGYLLGLDTGLRYSLLPSVSLMAQVNGLSKGRDRGDEAETADSGGRYVFFSPGVSVALGKATQIYGFVQQPLYQRVNGVQLTADRAYTAGVSFRF